MRAPFARERCRPVWRSLSSARPDAGAAREDFGEGDDPERRSLPASTPAQSADTHPEAPSALGTPARTHSVRFRPPLSSAILRMNSAPDMPANSVPRRSASGSPAM